MTDDDEPAITELTTKQNGSSLVVPTADALATLIHAFAEMMNGMEGRLSKSNDDMEERLLREINGNAEASKARWTRWESDFKEYRDEIDDRVGKLEGWRDEHVRKTLEWLQKQHEEEIIAAAKTAPLRTGWALFRHNWRTMLIVIFAVIGALGLANDFLLDFSRLIGR